jgi:DNA primase
MNDRFVEDVKSRVDLIEIVRKYAEIKKAGKNFVCRSPFRNEKTPSFSISPEKQMWYDFGAAEGGDAISFIEKIENCSFREAVEILADIAGVAIPKDFGADKGPSKNDKQDLFKLHQAAAEYFYKTWQQSDKAKKYTQGRGLTDGMMERWQLGYGGDVKDGLSQHLLKKGFKDKLIAESGVAFERSFGDQAMMDRFWGRIMIPICEPRNGDIIAFSGRDILEREKVGKYVNSPENPVYHKSATLFGLDRARNSIKELDAVILVEGNLDVVFAHERGFTNTVATCGTALTDDHLRALRRLTSNFYLAFDSDLAGKKATLKGVEMCLEMELNPYVISLDEVKDFGEFLVNEDNTIVLQQMIDDCPTALDFFLERFATKNLAQGIEGEKKFLDSFFFFLKLVKRPIEVDEYLKRLSQKLNRSQGLIEDEFQRYTSNQSNYTKPKFVPDAEVRYTREENFVGFVFAFWDTFADAITARKDDVLALLSEPNTHLYLKHKIENQELSPSDTTQVLAWQLWQENLFEDTNPDAKTLKISLDQYLQILKIETQKRARTAAGGDLSKQFKK